MKFKLFWKDRLILSSLKKDNKFYNEINIENLQQAKKEGFPQALIANINLISDTLPNIIQDRMPSAAFMKSKVDSNVDLEEQIIEYVNKTKCKRVTDYCSIEIEK